MHSPRPLLPRPQGRLLFVAGAALASPALALLLVTSALSGCLNESPGLRERVGSGRPPLPDDLGPVEQPDLGGPPADLAPADLEPARPDAGPDPDLGDPPLDAGGDSGSPGDAGEQLQIPVAIETMLGLQQVPAGQEVPVTCLVLDANGSVVPEITTSYVIHPATGWERPDGAATFIPTLPGELRIACQAPREGLLDATPAALLVVPGPVHTVTTEVDRDSLIAGDTVQATCLGYDAYGNPVPLVEPPLAVEPRGDGVTVGDPAASVDGEAVFPVTVTRTGFYHLSCPVEGAVQLLPATLAVEPDLPAHLAVAVSPAKPLYRIAEVVALLASVTDRYGNPVPGAPLTRRAMPVVPEFGSGRFRFDQDGLYALSATVSGATADGADLSGSVSVVVSSEGPSVACLNPSDGGALVHTPGQPLQLLGQASDPNGVQRVLVDGQEVALDRSGQFSLAYTPRFGINFVEIIAEDVAGVQSSTFCSFLVADRYHPQNDLLGDGVSFRLGQGAIDDGSADGDLSSLGEILRRILNSGGLVTTVDALLSSMNPLYSNCEWNCPWPFGGSCCMDVQLTYRNGSFSLPGPNTLTMTLVEGGLAVSARLPSPSLGFDAAITGPDVGGTVGVEFIEVGFTFDAGLGPDGRPRVTLRQGSEWVNVGSLTHDLNWWIDWLVSVVNWLFDGYFRTQISNAILTQLRTNIDAALDGVLGGLDISALGQQFTVPGLPGQPPVTIGVGVGFTRAEFNPSRALFGLGMRLTGPVNVVGDAGGAPIPPGAVLLDPGGARNLGAAVSYGVLNKALFTVWTAGYLSFDAATLIPGLDSAPAGTELSLAVSLPPVARAGAAAGELKLGLGGARLRLRYPGIFDSPVEILLAAEASAGAVLVGDAQLEFRAVTIDRLLFRTLNVELDPVTRTLLESLLTEIVQSLLDQTINGALPMLPIPQFSTPAMLAPYGIPTGTRLGVRNPLMTTTAGHFVVQGNFGR